MSKTILQQQMAVAKLLVDRFSDLLAEFTGNGVEGILVLVTWTCLLSALVMYVTTWRAESRRKAAKAAELESYAAQVIRGGSIKPSYREALGTMSYDSAGPYISLVHDGIDIRVRLPKDKQSDLSLLALPPAKEAYMPHSSMEAAPDWPKGHVILLAGDQPVGVGFRLKTASGSVLCTATHVLKMLVRSPDISIQHRDCRFPMDRDWMMKMTSAPDHFDVTWLDVPSAVWSVMGVAALKMTRDVVQDVATLSGPLSGWSRSRGMVWPGPQMHEVFHNCSTQPSFSGSPVLDGSGRVAAVHVGAFSANANQATALWFFETVPASFRESGYTGRRKRWNKDRTLDMAGAKQFVRDGSLYALTSSAKHSVYRTTMEIHDNEPVEAGRWAAYMEELDELDYVDSDREGCTPSKPTGLKPNPIGPSLHGFLSGTSWESASLHDEESPLPQTMRSDFRAWPPSLSGGRAESKTASKREAATPPSLSPTPPPLPAKESPQPGGHASKATDQSTADVPRPLTRTQRRRRARQKKAQLSSAKGSTSTQRAERKPKGNRLPPNTTSTASLEASVMLLASAVPKILHTLEHLDRQLSSMSSSRQSSD